MSSHQGNNTPFFVKNKKKKNTKESEKSRKWKLIEEEVTELKRKKSLLVDTISELHKDADRFVYEVKNSNDLKGMKSLLTKSNSFCTATKEKEDKLQEYEHRLKELNKRKNFF